MVILAYRPVREIQEMLHIRVTGVGLVDGNVETYFDYNGQPGKSTEEPWQVFQALWITGATLAGVQLRNGNIYYTLDGIEQARKPASFLERAWYEHDGRLRTLTGARLAGDGVDYDVQDGGRADVRHETEIETLGRIRIMGVKLTGVELNGGDVYYTLTEA
jgi:hypothetical protein